MKKELKKLSSGTVNLQVFIFFLALANALMFISFDYAYAQEWKGAIGIQLKDGTIVKGTIIPIDQERFKIRRPDERVFVYRYNEVERFLKEEGSTPYKYDNYKVSEPTAYPSNRGRFLISLGGGIFIPGGDLKDANYDNGPAGTVSFIYAIGGFLGIGMDVNHNQSKYSTTISRINYERKVETTSLETLVYLQPNNWRVQPYIAIGVGEYYNYVEGTDGGLRRSDSGSGPGFVAKAGLRAFLTDNFFIGGYAKYFYDQQKVYSIYWNGAVVEKDYNLGGTYGIFEIGYRF